MLHRSAVRSCPGRKGTIGVVVRVMSLDTFGKQPHLIALPAAACIRANHIMRF